MNLARPQFPAHPLDIARRRTVDTGASTEAAWNAVSARIVALAVIVLQHVNPSATEHHVLSYVRHSTLRDLLDEASILEPDLTARLMRDPLSDWVVGAFLDAVRRDRGRRGRMLSGTYTTVRRVRVRVRPGDRGR